MILATPDLKPRWFNLTNWAQDSHRATAIAVPIPNSPAPRQGRKANHGVSHGERDPKA